MSNNKYIQPQTPPAPLFLGKKERDYTKQINDEIIERMIGQAVLYYPISLEHTDFHPLYGEAIKKSFLAPIRVFALVNWEGSETTMTNYGVDKTSRIAIGFHKRRLTEDQHLFVREGDFVQYGDRHYEIVKLGEPRALFGQPDHRFEISAIAVVSRKGNFDAS